MRTREYVIFFLRLHHVKVDDEQSSGMKSESSWTIIQKKKSRKNSFLCKYTRSTDGDDYDSLSSILIIQPVRVSSNVFFLLTRSRSLAYTDPSKMPNELIDSLCYEKYGDKLLLHRTIIGFFQSNRTDWHERTCRRRLSSFLRRVDRYSIDFLSSIQR